jgi:hypothetical protein
MTALARPLETGWLSDTPVSDNLLRRFLHNHADSNVALAEAGGGRVERRPEVVLSSYDIPVPYLNMAVLLRPLTGVEDEVLDATEAFFADGQSATLLSAWPTPDLSRRGWELMGHPTFVARGPRDEVVLLEQSPVTVTVAATPDDLAVAERIVAEGYPLPPAVGLPPNAVLSEALLESPYLVRIGWLEGEPCAVGSSFVGHGVVNLCLAATLPAGRRRGLWSALANARMADGHDLPAVAFTSDFSRPGFEKLGFLPITRFSLWLRPEA